VDGRTWQSYKQNLEANLVELHSSIHRGTYRALPSRRRYIPKPDGRQRPLGIAALEDKIVQRAVVEVLNTIYEEDFLGFSYGFRPGRGRHGALDALAVWITRTKVNWIVDADIPGFFDAVSHEWLMRFVEHRIGDRRINRLIRKWLKAGVMEDGELVTTETGTPQGAVASPLLANIYLHYVFDLWADRWRKRHARGQVIIVRYADDIVMGFEHEGEAKRFVADMRLRMEKFALSLHPDKTRLIEFGRYAVERRARRASALTPAAKARTRSKTSLKCSESEMRHSLMALSFAIKPRSSSEAFSQLPRLERRAMAGGLPARGRHSTPDCPEKE
jgi:RNA-directed DNA polymerase